MINPDGARNQIEGGAIQATSWACKERVRFDGLTITSVDWESYPILRFSEVPHVDVELMPSDGNPSLGVGGETSQGADRRRHRQCRVRRVGRAGADVATDPGPDRRRDAGLNTQTRRG